MPDISYHLNSGSNNCATLVDNDDYGQIHPFSSPRRVASALLRDQRSLFRLRLISTACLSPSSRLWLSWHWAFVCTISSANDALPTSFLLVWLIPSHSSDARSPVTSSEKSLWSLMSPECLLYQHISLWSIGLRGQYRVIDPIMPFSCLCVMLISPHPCTASLMSPLAGSLSLST